jgi:hypothetical protein
MFPKYIKALIDSEFAYDGMLLGQKLEDSTGILQT